MKSKKSEVIALLKKGTKVQDIQTQTGLTKQRIYQIRKEQLPAEQPTDTPLPVEKPDAEDILDWVDGQLKEAMTIILNNLRDGCEIHPKTAEWVEQLIALAEVIYDTRFPNQRGTGIRQDANDGKDPTGTTGRSRNFVQRLEEVRARKGQSR